MDDKEKGKSLLVVPQNTEKSEKNLMTENWVYKAFVKMAYRLINKPLSVFRIIKDVIAHLQKYESVKELTEEVKNQLFDPFFTTKPVGKGTGLGLAISYQIVVEKHNGQIQCFSEPDRGAEFTINIPIV